MIKPISELPFIIQDNIGLMNIISENNPEEIICKELYEQDAEFIIQSCNNFEEAINWLNLIVNSTTKDGIIKLQKEDLNNIKEFLNNIK